MSVVNPENAKPARFKVSAAILKWLADTVPPPIDMVGVDADTAPPVEVATVAVSVTEPATLPAVNTTDANPLASVKPVAVVGVPSSLPIYSPPALGWRPPLGPARTKLTTSPAPTEFELSSRTKNTTVDFSTRPLPFTPNAWVVAETYSIAEFSVDAIIIGILALVPPTDALSVTVPGTVLATNVADAKPLVVVAVGVTDPIDALLTAKVTTVPFATADPNVSVMFACSDTVSPTSMVFALADSETVTAPVPLPVVVVVVVVDKLTLVSAGPLASSPPHPCNANIKIRFNKATCAANRDKPLADVGTAFMTRRN